MWFILIIMLIISSANTTLQFSPLPNHSRLCIVRFFLLNSCAEWVEISRSILDFGHVCTVLQLSKWESKGWFSSVLKEAWVPALTPALVFVYCRPCLVKLWCCLCWLTPNCMLAVENGSPVGWMIMSRWHGYAVGGYSLVLSVLKPPACSLVNLRLPKEKGELQSRSACEGRMWQMIPE